MPRKNFFVFVSSTLVANNLSDLLRNLYGVLIFDWLWFIKYTVKQK